jgi:hypothetical protein
MVVYGLIVVVLNLVNHRGIIKYIRMLGYIVNNSNYIFLVTSVYKSSVSLMISNEQGSN